jgi:trk system potassium uptake protein TrkH
MRVLQYAIRPIVVGKYFGELLTALAALTAVPLIVSIILGDYRVSVRYLAVIAFSLALGVSLMRIRAPERMQVNEAMVITALIFSVSPLLMAWPVMASGLGFLDALFETISAVTTTGLSTLASLQGKPDTFLFGRAWMAWVGGVGIVVLSLAVMIQPGVTAKRLDISEDYDDDLIGSTRGNARRIFAIYLIITGAGIILLWIAGSAWFESILYTFAAVSTGGFAPQDASLAGVENTLGQFTVIMVSVLGGISLLLYHRIYHFGWKALLNDRQLQSFCAAGVLTALLLTLFLWLKDHMAWRSALHHGVLNGLSAQSTAGFSSLDIAELGQGSKLTLIFSMAAGGCIGSTAGGIKILRLLILFRLLLLLLQRTGMPANAVSAARLSGRRLESEEISDALCLIAVFLGFVTLSWMPFLALGCEPLSSLFEIVSAISTTGLSAGLSGPELHPVLKGVLCANMLLGRLEIMAWLVFLYPRTWIGRRMEA